MSVSTKAPLKLPPAGLTPLPTPQQLAWQRAQFGMFCHFGINTFNNKEWSAGQLDPVTFAPTELDPRQWVDVALRAGMKYLILTAKHHDGFCLWPTETTPYSVVSSPGKIDVVQRVAEACQAAGLGFGLYLSPWDRNAECYADPAAYDDFYIRQMTELCTRYGELYEIWLDGAGSEGRTYAWERIMQVIDRHQPEAMIFNMGNKTIRWVGNEDGLASDPCLYAVQSVSTSAFTEAQEGSGKWEYLPPECDVAIRQHWFWQDDDIATLKSPEHLLGIIYRSIGRGANLLLNLGPDRRGLLDDADAAALLEATSRLQNRFLAPSPATVTHSGRTIHLQFPAEVTIDHLKLREDLAGGQRIAGYHIFQGEQLIAAGGTIGVEKWEVFPTIRCSALRIELGNDSHESARITSAEGFQTGCTTLPHLPAPLDYKLWAEKADPRDATPPRWRPCHS